MARRDVVLRPSTLVGVAEDSLKLIEVAKQLATTASRIDDPVLSDSLVSSAQTILATARHISEAVLDSAR